MPWRTPGTHLGPALPDSGKLDGALDHLQRATRRRARGDRALFLFTDDLFLTLVGLITMSATRHHQRVGDLVASTYVVRT